MARSAGRNAQLLRLLRILRELDRLGGIDLYELAERHGTTVRTIRRDLDTLREAGLPVREDGETGKRKRWTLDCRGRTQPLSTLLDASHYLALRVAMGDGGAVRGMTGLFATLEDLAGKIEGVIGRRGRAQLAAIEACFTSHERFAYQRSAPDLLWPLLQAIPERRLCRVTYRPPRPEATTSILTCLPLKLFAHDGALYLRAHVPKREGLITLNLQRVVALKVLDTHGTPPEDAASDALEAGAFLVHTGGEPTRYRLRFAAHVAPYIRERVWHASQTVADAPGGGVELVFTCGASYEVTAWVASWREGVEVLEPPSLRKELAELGAWMARAYGGTRRGRR